MCIGGVVLLEGYDAKRLQGVWRHRSMTPNVWVTLWIPSPGLRMDACGYVVRHCQPFRQSGEPKSHTLFKQKRALSFHIIAHRVADVDHIGMLAVVGG